MALAQVQHIKTGYVPRPLQYKLHNALARFNVLVLHRRFGKTVFAINELIDQSLRCQKRNPQYAYVAPTYKQAKQVAWQYFVDYTRNIPGVRANKSELCIYIDRPHRKNDAGEDEPDVIKLMLIGADDPDVLRGIYLDGVIIDEYAQCDPILWGQILRPALADRPGWAIFIGTPKGQNHFYHRYNKAKDYEDYAKDYRRKYDVSEKHLYYVQFEKDFGLHENLNDRDLQDILDTIPKLEVDLYLEYRKYKVACNWYTSLQKSSETGILPRAEIEEMKEDLSEDEVAQELECDFNAAILGSYFGHFVRKAEQDDRITDIGYNPIFPVDTFWDIGVSDKCVIWFRQKIGNLYHYIDYLEDNGKGVDFYIKELQKKEYVYGRHVWPHDGNVKEFGTGVSRFETAKGLGLKRLEIQKRQSKQDQIQASRLRLPVSYFDRIKCDRGLDCLLNYQKEWDGKMQMFKEKPKHDWASNGADAFHYSALDNRASRFEGDESNLPRIAVSDYNEFI